MDDKHRDVIAAKTVDRLYPAAAGVRTGCIVGAKIHVNVFPPVESSNLSYLIC